MSSLKLPRRTRSGGKRARSRSKPTNGKRVTTDAVEILNDMFIGGDPERIASLAQARLDLQIGQLIYDSRVAAKLTQRQLANRVGTTQSVVSRLEDADYSGHSLTMLARIARALGMRLKLEVV